MAQGYDSDTLKLIQNQHTYLCKLRDNRERNDRRLHEDIAVYEYILKHDDPERVAEIYLQTISKERHIRKTNDVPKSLIARMLGWEIKL